MIKILLFFLFISCTFKAYSQEGGKRTTLGIENAKQELAAALENTTEKKFIVDKVIKDKKTAVSVSEAMLFNIYGKEKIVKQRPYEGFLINGYWVLNGTLPQGWDGGTFLIIINSIDGKVIKLTHGK